MKTKEPPYTEPYVRWCGRSVDKIIIYLLPDLGSQYEGMKSYQLLVESAEINHWSVSGQLFSIYTDGKEDKNMNQETIGKFVATCRKEKGLTQKQLAEKLNITNRAVSKWETGVSRS